MIGLFAAFLLYGISLFLMYSTVNNLILFLYGMFIVC